MNVKALTGGVLVVLGLIGLIYAAVMFANSGNGAGNGKSLIIFGILGIIFFVAGISLVRAIREETPH